MIPKTCNYCQGEYFNRRKTSKYCSRTCLTKNTLCKLERTDSWKLNISNSNKGKKFSDITKTRISNSKSGIKQTPEVVKNRSLKNTGKRRSKEVKEKMRSSALLVDRSKRARGKRIHTWKGGISIQNNSERHSPEYKQWRLSIFKRDNYTCVLCGKVGGELNADHIKPFSLFVELRFDINNGRTLCKPCHQKTDTYGGRMNKYKKENNVLL